MREQGNFVSEMSKVITRKFKIDKHRLHFQSKGKEFTKIVKKDVETPHKEARIFKTCLINRGSIRNTLYKYLGRVENEAYKAKRSNL